MNWPRARVLLLAAIFAFAAGPLLPAEDWTTSDGKVYHDVRVVKVEDDAVTILHRDGGALLPLANLPPALQARFHYDPDKAKAAAVARAHADGDSAGALAAEKIQAAKIKAAQDAKYKADKEAIDAAKAAAAAAEPADDALHTGQFDVGKSDDTRTHFSVHDALSTNDAETPALPAPTGQ